MFSHLACTSNYDDWPPKSNGNGNSDVNVSPEAALNLRLLKEDKPMFTITVTNDKI